MVINLKLKYIILQHYISVYMRQTKHRFYFTGILLLWWYRDGNIYQQNNKRAMYNSSAPKLLPSLARVISKLEVGMTVCPLVHDCLHARSLELCSASQQEHDGRSGWHSVTCYSRWRLRWSDVLFYFSCFLPDFLPRT